MPVVFLPRIAAFLLLMTSLTVPLLAQAASVSLCPAAAPDDASRQFHDRDGRLVSLSVTDDAPVARDCQVVELPGSAERVQWLAPSDIAPNVVPPTLTLQGRFDGERPVVSEVIHAGASVGEPDFLPLGDDVLPLFRATPFGVEERSHVDAGYRLTCGAGRQVAGIALQAALRWAQLPGLVLALELSGQGRVDIAVADAVRHANGAPLTMGSVNLAASRQTLRLTLPANAQPWSVLTLVCPDTTASLTLHALRLEPPAAGMSRTTRATWLWSPASWLQRRAQVWQLAEQEHLNRLYVTVPTSGESVTQPDALADFVRDARTRGIAVWAVIGDRHDVLAENLPALLARATAYRSYNESHADAALGGLQLDIEPYLLPGYSLAPAFWRQRYLATVTAVHGRLEQRLSLDLVQPVWWGTHPAWGSQLLDALVQPGLSITVMNYRTTAPALRAGALPYLSWAQSRAMPVSMALESGSLSPDGQSETRRRYSRSDGKGELWLLDISGVQVMALFDSAQAGLPGQAYALAAEGAFDNSNITLQAAPERLQALAKQMNDEWSVWPAYTGLAIHGLEETRLQTVTAP